MTEDKRPLSDKELEKLFADMSAEQRGDGTAGATAFLNSLSAIPSNHRQEAPAAGGVAFGKWIERLLDPDRLLSVRGLATQGAFALILLVSGFATGLELSEADAEFSDYDISASLFSDDDDTSYTIDG